MLQVEKDSVEVAQVEQVVKADEAVANEQARVAQGIKGETDTAGLARVTLPMYG